MEWGEILKKIEDLRQLKDDWDGEGAIAPTVPVMGSVADCMSMLKNAGVPSPDQVSAACDGSVIISWNFGEIYFEMEISWPGRAEVMVKKDVSGQPVVYFNAEW